MSQHSFKMQSNVSKLLQLQKIEYRQKSDSISQGIVGRESVGRKDLIQPVSTALLPNRLDGKALAQFSKTIELEESMYQYRISKGKIASS